MASADTGRAINDLRDELAAFASRESELAAAELKPAAKHAAFGSGFFAGAAIFAVHALWMLVIAIALFVCWLLTVLFDLSLTAGLLWGFVVSAVLSVGLAAILVKLGMGRFKKVKKPEATIAEAKATANALVDAFLRPEETTLTVVETTPSSLTTTGEPPFARPK